MTDYRAPLYHAVIRLRGTTVTENEQSRQDGSGPGLPSVRSADDGGGLLNDPAGGAARVPAGTAAGEPQVSPAQVCSTAREVIRQLAPGELMVFDAVADSWAQGDWPRLA